MGKNQIGTMTETCRSGRENAKYNQILYHFL